MKANPTLSGLYLGSAISTWGSFLSRSMLCSMAIGFALGMVLGLVYGFARHPEFITPLCTLVCWLVSLPVTVWAFRGGLVTAPVWLLAGAGQTLIYIHFKQEYQHV